MLLSLISFTALIVTKMNSLSPFATCIILHWGIGSEHQFVICIVLKSGLCWTTDLMQAMLYPEGIS